MRKLLLLIMCIAGISCREIEPIGSEPISSIGYGLRGTVTSANGIPLENVDVTLWYDVSATGYAPVDTSRVEIRDSVQLLEVTVYTPTGDFVRELVRELHLPGFVERPVWDRIDQFGNFVPSGKYLVRYFVSSRIQKEEKRLVQGTVTTKTDINGRFSISSERFPIGERFDRYTAAGEYANTAQVGETIVIDLFLGGLSSSYNIVLKKDQIINQVFTLQ